MGDASDSAPPSAERTHQTAEPDARAAGARAAAGGAAGAGAAGAGAAGGSTSGALVFSVDQLRQVQMRMHLV